MPLHPSYPAATGHALAISSPLGGAQGTSPDAISPKFVSRCAPRKPALTPPTPLKGARVGVRGSSMSKLATPPNPVAVRFQKRIFRSSLVISGHRKSSFPARVRTQPICGNNPSQIQVARSSIRAVVESRVRRPLRRPPCPKFGRIPPCAPGFPWAAHRTWLNGFEIWFSYGVNLRGGSLAVANPGRRQTTKVLLYQNLVGHACRLRIC